jgi:hypothetical protein
MPALNVWLYEYVDSVQRSKKAEEFDRLKKLPKVPVFVMAEGATERLR